MDRCDLAVADFACLIHLSKLLELSAYKLDSFSQWQPLPSFTAAKLASASFGEVFGCAPPTVHTDRQSVFKVVPLRTVGVQTLQDFTSNPQDVINEVKLLQSMSGVKGYVVFRGLRVLQGRPPQTIIDACRVWEQASRQNRSSNDMPGAVSKGEEISDMQLWAVIEMDYAGYSIEHEIETGAPISLAWIWNVFWSVALTVARGERVREFEHRDLHLGNICIRSAQCVENGLPSRGWKFNPLEINFIDYGLSRGRLETGEVVYQNLSTVPYLFDGDGQEDHQYQIYRYMRRLIFCGNPLAPDVSGNVDQAEGAENAWRQYQPKTNLLWLHLIVDKLLRAYETSPVSRGSPDYAIGNDTNSKPPNGLYEVLQEVASSLKPRRLGGDVRSVEDLVKRAIAYGWLCAEEADLAITH